MHMHVSVTANRLPVYLFYHLCMSFTLVLYSDPKVVNDF